MIKKTLKTIKRAPVRAVAVLLFAAVISVIICILQESNDAEMRNYQETQQSIPITVTLTDPTGTNTDQVIPETWVLDIFTGKNPVQVIDKNNKEYITNISFAEYFKDIQVKSQRVVDELNTIEAKDIKNPMIYGITSLTCEKMLLPEYGGQITWYAGYDESIFAGEDSVCIIPEGMSSLYDNGKGELVLDFLSTSHSPTVTVIDGEPVIEFKTTEFHCTVKIVGTYTGGDGKSIYCPYPIVAQICQELEEQMIVWSLSATLADNSKLDEFRQKMSLCFIEPSQDDNEIPWEYSLKCSGFNTDYTITRDTYSYALDINDDNLFDLSAILEDSIKFNRTVTVFVVILSVISGFLVGFLMIRRRKRDIMLMRMVGESNARVFLGFALEQLICIILGIAIGGAYYMWNPINNLVIFAVAYFIALSLALVIFMSKKLIKNVKEDE